MDTIVWLVAMSATALISVELGLLVGIVFSMSCIIYKTQNPKVSKLIDILEHWSCSPVFKGRCPGTFRCSCFNAPESNDWVNSMTVCQKGSSDYLIQMCRTRNAS